MFFVDLDTLEERNATQVKRGFVSAISTGAIPEEYMFEENDSGDLYTEADAEEKFGWKNLWDAMWGDSDILTLVVTKAKMIENSLVTIGSNENAIAMQNAIGKHFQEYAEEYKKTKTNSAEETETEKPTEPTTATVEETAEPEKSAEDTPTTETTETVIDPALETEQTVEQTAGEEVEEESPADENEAKLADAIEKIGTLEETVAKQNDTIEEQKTTFETFKNEVYDTLKDFIKSHNDAVENLEQVNSALGSIRTSKGMPHVRSETIEQNKSPLG